MVGLVVGASVKDTNQKNQLLKLTKSIWPIVRKKKTLIKNLYRILLGAKTNENDLDYFK